MKQVTAHYRVNGTVCKDVLETVDNNVNLMIHEDGRGLVKVTGARIAYRDTVRIVSISMKDGPRFIEELS